MHFNLYTLFLHFLQLSIIIVNYNVKIQLEQCLYTVEKACRNIQAEVYVVDNASSDGSRQYFEGKFPMVNFQWNTENLGFGKACNSVLSIVKGDYVLFLNPDTLVPEDCFEKCIHFFESHSDCGALGVRMVDDKGRFLKESKRGMPSPSASFFKMTGLVRLFPHSKLIAAYYLGHLSEFEIHKVDVLAGAFMMLSKKTLHYVKGFDERFFMYGEDIDLSIRLMQAGFSNYYFPETTIIHSKGESTPKKSAFYNHHFYGSMIIFVQKYYADKPVQKSVFVMAIRLSHFLAEIKRILKSISILK